MGHVLNHVVDHPTRDGKHGVFNASSSDALRLIDEAWRIVQTPNDPRVRVISSDSVRTKYAVNMGSMIGYEGGREGAARGNPTTRELFIAVDRGNELVTSFPKVYP